MSEALPESYHSFALQKKMTDPSRQPLEVYHLSHDLRGPLNSILGFTELLLEEIEGPLNEIQHTDLAAIYQSAQNLLHLVNTVVDLSKLESNRLIFDFGPVDLAHVIHEIVASDFGTARPEQVEVVANLNQTIPPARGDRSRIEQMLKSILRFAFKIKKKGPITLAAHSDTQAVIIEVDLGEIGLPQGELPELFELSVKVDASGRSELGRGGLDLPLARFLAEKQQGRIWAEHKNNTNLTFYVSLPVQEAEP
ncbi:MAG: HAMP domain-containing histidine kinase [Chloroflexi bacterium]|nr:HAMP domain-containing histidine kinase [Chloroflexota bacterium]